MMFQANQANDPAQNVYLDFSKTKYGQLLSQKARYHRFCPSGYSVQHWERLLGRDVNNLHHMHETILLSEWFVRSENSIQPNYFSEQERLYLTVTAALHDQAEAIVGDIPHGRKSPSEQAREHRVLREYEAMFAPNIHGRTLDLYRYGRDNIAFSQEMRKLPLAFRSIELIGFMKNMIVALHRLKELRGVDSLQGRSEYLGARTKHKQQVLAVMLERMAADILGSGVLEKLILLGRHFPSIHAFLRHNNASISEGFSLDSNVFEWYNSGENVGAGSNEVMLLTKKFAAEKKKWEAWLRSV